MRIALTGSSGLIGQAVMAELIGRGDEVIRIVRPGSRAVGIFWDPRTGQIEADRLQDLDAVIHLAGESIASLWTPARKRSIRTSRVQGTSLLATTLAGLERPPKVLVSASAVGFYGNRSESQPIDETAPRGAGFLAEVSQLWESAADPARRAGIRVVHPRFGLVLSKRGGALKFALPAFYAGLGGKLGSGRQFWSWVALDDVAGSILHMIETPSLSGPVNVTAPNPVSNADFTRTLSQTLHRPAVIPVPAFALKLGGGMAEELILSSARVVPKKLLESGYKFRHPELREALQSVLAD